jgi:hypothetical protein
MAAPTVSACPFIRRRTPWRRPKRLDSGYLGGGDRYQVKDSSVIGARRSTCSRRCFAESGALTVGSGSSWVPA